jgi:hypothetical protein
MHEYSCVNFLVGLHVLLKLQRPVGSEVVVKYLVQRFCYAEVT